MASIASIITNYVIASLAVTRIGHRGLALSVSAVALVNFLLLFFFLRRKLGGIEGRNLLTVLTKVMIASAAMGALAWLTSRKLGELLGMDSLVMRATNVGISIILGITVFYLIARVLGVSEIVMLTNSLRRRLLRQGKR